MIPYKSNSIICGCNDLKMRIYDLDQKLPPNEIFVGKYITILAILSKNHIVGRSDTVI